MNQFWQARAKRVVAQVNAARWLEFVAPAAAGWALTAGCLLLIARRAGWNTRPFLWVAGAAVALIAGFAFWRMRRRRFTHEDALVRLDLVLGLHSRLISAAAGVGPWPSPLPGANGGFRWRWDRLAVPPALGAAFAIAALWLPISPGSTGGPVKTEAPVAWSQVEAAVEALKRNEVADPDALAAIEQKLEALRRQAADTWYSQSSLEAGAALQEETSHAVASLERNLNSASQALAHAGTANEGIAPVRAEKVAMWNEALKGMQSGALPLNKADLAAMKQCDSAKCSLSKGQIQALQKKLGQHGAACQMALGSLGSALGNIKCDDRLDAKQDQPNQPGGGGSTAPLGLRQDPTALQPGQDQALKSEDLLHADLGDIVKVTAGEPKIDLKALPGPTAGGAATSGGTGGEAVWKMAPTPGEEAVLKAYFK